VSGDRHAQRIAEWLIHAACRRLPADERAERCREWTAELPAILADEGIRPSLLRALRAIAFGAGISKTTRQLTRLTRAGARRTRNAQWRAGGLPTRPTDLAIRVVIGLSAWLVFVAGAIALVAVVGTRADPHPWPLLLIAALAVAFDAFCLRDIAGAAEVRYLRKWTWAIICLIQIPLGGILYLSIGRISPSRPAPPDHAQP
jgi:hypothetical protein